MAEEKQARLAGIEPTTCRLWGQCPTAELQSVPCVQSFCPSSSLSDLLLIDFQTAHFRTYGCFWLELEQPVERIDNIFVDAYPTYEQSCDQSSAQHETSLAKKCSC